MKRFAVDDGPGIRTTLFLKGCPLHCWWCHNPEGQTSTSELMYRRARCTLCGQCLKTCPNQAISINRETVTIDRNKCNACGRCCSECASDALVIMGKRIGIDEVTRNLETDNVFFEESGGGVTISGGEPLLQPEFLGAILERCRQHNIHTAVDTCGYASSKIIQAVAAKTNLFLYDLKIMNDTKHRQYTGVSNLPILRT